MMIPSSVVRHLLEKLRIEREPSTASGVNRRWFVRSAAAAAATATLPLFGGRPRTPSLPAASGSSRADRVYEARVRAAKLDRERPRPVFRATGDEARYPQLWGSYAKGLPCDGKGEVDKSAYAAYLHAIETADSEEFERIPLGGYLKLANPQAAFAIELVGPDAETIPLATPPALASAEQAGELAEMYWHALLRDVPFDDYDSNATVAAACAEMSRMSDYRGPKESGAVTPRTLFRGLSAGGLKGPYVSQFLHRDIPLSPIRVPFRIRTAVPGRDFMTTPAEWNAILNGQLAGVNTFDDTPRYIRTGRDLGEYVHRDFTYQAALSACMMLIKMSAPLDGGIPYQYSITQGGFVTFGPSDIFHLVATVANGALKATWYQKWLVHRKARPEEIAGLLHVRLSGKNDVPLHRDILESDAVRRTKERTGSWLLPQAYPEASPSHPSYPSGHAVIAGACTAVLKACFNDAWVLPNNIHPTRDGSALEPYRGAELTVGGELDKLAENVAFGRNFAGIHWRSDAIEGIKFGEAYTIAYLREMKLTASEFFHGFSLTKYDGTRINV